ncbi:MAG: hypothetical protein ACE5JP_11250 [Candidatus Bipolaricaulia bacterium]
MEVEKTDYKGWQNCYRLFNDLVDLIVTTDVGPRIIRFGFVNGENEFKEYEEMIGVTGGDEWRIYGGHRLWHAPEAKPRTYFPDNSPVQLEQHPDSGFVRLIQPTEPTTGIQKEIDIRLDPNQAHVELTHRLHNANLWAVEFAPWGLSVMAQGGKSIIPLPPRGSHEEHLLPTTTVALWAYTDMTDPRWTWGSKYVMLHQDPKIETPQKVGVMVTDGWVACARNGHLFVKKLDYINGAHYPDFGCSVETFTNADMLEVETLGPLVHLQPGAAVEHVEHWFLFDDVPVPENDADVDEHVLPKVKAATVQ